MGHFSQGKGSAKLKHPCRLGASSIPYHCFCLLLFTRIALKSSVAGQRSLTSSFRGNVKGSAHLCSPLSPPTDIHLAVLSRAHPHEVHRTLHFQVTKLPVYVLDVSRRATQSILPSLTPSEKPFININTKYPRPLSLIGSNFLKG